MQHDPTVYGDIKLGMKVKDLVSGVIGTAFSYWETTNLRQVSIQPLGDGTTYPDPQGFDVSTVRVVDAVHLTDTTTPYDMGLASKFDFGDEVQDILLGFKGKITSRSLFMNGCVVHSVQPPMDKDGKMPEVRVINANDLVKITPTQVQTPTPRKGGAPTRTGRAV